MKILVVSMRSIHTIRWLSQLKDSGHEVHWFDILNTGYINELDWVTQHTNWRHKLGNFKGRTFLKKNLPYLHSLLENDVETKFEALLKEVKPDLVHSFALHIAAFPILEIMKQHDVKWLYSSWGSDLYYHQHLPERRKEIDAVLPHVDYMFSDCQRDVTLAKTLGFKGQHLGVFPGGGGYDLKKMEQYKLPLEQRNCVTLKGYDNKFSKALQVVKALALLDASLVSQYDLVVYSAATSVQDYLNENGLRNFKSVRCISGNKNISQEELFSIFGQSILSIGNNTSDGIPNTLIESMSLGAFPIQSNPGGATEELIVDSTNGLLIEDPMNVEDIKSKIETALTSINLLATAFDYNTTLVSKYEASLIKKAVLRKYGDIVT